MFSKCPDALQKARALIADRCSAFSQMFCTFRGTSQEKMFLTNIIKVTLCRIWKLQHHPLTAAPFPAPKKSQEMSSSANTSIVCEWVRAARGFFFFLGAERLQLWAPAEQTVNGHLQLRANSVHSGWIKVFDLLSSKFPKNIQRARMIQKYGTPVNRRRHHPVQSLCSRKASILVYRRLESGHLCPSLARISLLQKANPSGGVFLHQRPAGSNSFLVFGNINVFNVQFITLDLIWMALRIFFGGGGGTKNMFTCGTFWHGSWIPF